MEFALQVVSYMRDLIGEKLSNNDDFLKNEDFKKIYNDDLKKLDELEFVKKYFFLVDNDMLYKTWTILVNYQTVYDEKIDFFQETVGDNEQFNWNFALPFMATYKMINDYTTTKKEKTFDYFKNSSLKKYKKDFLYKEKFGISVLKGFLRAICDDDLIETNEELMQQNQDDYNVLMGWRSKLYFKVNDLNDILRTTFFDLYSYYSDKGEIKTNIASYIWEFFNNGTDPVNTLENYGFDEENIKKCKRLMIRLMLADLYEDSKNNQYDREWFTLNDFGDSVNDEKIMSMLKSNYDSSFYLNLAKRKNYYTEVLGNKFLAEILFYNYCEVLENPDRMASNRRKTFREDRQLELAKINPNYALDEF